MKLEPTKCLKCKTIIKNNGNTLSNYKTAVFKRDVGDLLCVGLCTSCTIQPNEYEDVIKAVVEYHGEKMNGKIIEYWGGDKEIDEYCKIESSVFHPVTPKDSATETPNKAGNASKEYNKANQRGFKNV